MSDTEKRLTELETALAHAERAAEELSEVVRDQAAQIDLMTRQIAALARRLRDLEEAASTSPGRCPGGRAPAALVRDRRT